MPTDGSSAASQIRDRLSRVQVETLERNCREFGVPIHSIGSARQGIVSRHALVDRLLQGR